MELKNENPVETPQKELDLILQNEITTYFHWLLPLCFILAYQRFIPWFYEHFIQIGSFFWDNPGYDKEYIWIDYQEHLTDTFKNGILFDHFLSLGYDDFDKSNFINFLINKIDQNYYAVIHLDEYYLPGKSSYQTRHFVHQSLIYGYDRDKRQFLAAGFNAKNVLAKNTIDFISMGQAFQSGETYYKDDSLFATREIIQLFLPAMYQETYQYDIQKFLFELADYAFSRTAQSKQYIFKQKSMLNKCGINNFKFGLNVYDCMVLKLKERLEGKHSFDYRFIHLLSEHKKGIYKRLNYLQTQCNPRININNDILEYKKIADQFETVRMNYLRHALIDSGFQNISVISPKNVSAIEYMIGIISNAKQREADILSNILSACHEHWLGNYQHF